MKKFPFTVLHRVCAVGIAALFTVTGASAAVIQFSDTYDPNPDPLIAFGGNQSYSFNHSIVADQDGAGLFWTGVYGFNPLTDTITSAAIALSFKDESTDTVSESVQLIFDAESFGTQVITSGGATYTATISSGWGALLNDGILNVTLQNAGQTSGHQSDRSDFLFLESTLTVSVDRNGQVEQTYPISEPNSIVLILLALTALSISRLRTGAVQTEKR